MSKKYALHIGLNNVNPDRYAGWDGFLRFAENDMNALNKLAAGAGFDATETLRGKDATREKVTGRLADLAVEADPGALVLLTYSGHGGLLDDENGDEPFEKDQTWCLFDSQLLDDELWLAWSKFRAGVRILVISDSCHSGTVVRAVDADDPRLNVPEGAKLMPPAYGLKAYQSNRDFYRELGRKIPPPHTVEVAAAIKSISACRDDEYAFEDAAAKQGHFTQALLKAWNEGAFQGTYEKLYQELYRHITKDQMPELRHFGAADSGYDLSRPF